MTPPSAATASIATFAFAREKLGRLSEDDDGTAELDRLIATAPWPEDDEPVAPSIWLDGFLAAGVLAPAGAAPEALYTAVEERFRNTGDQPGTEPLGTYMANRYEELAAAYGEVRTVATMFLAADDLGMTEWSQGFAQGVRIMKSAWPTEWFVAEERRMVSLLARLAKGELRGVEDCTDVVTFIQWRWQGRYGSGT